MGRTYYNKRILHRYLAYITVIPLFITMTTGFLYKICRDLIGMEKEKIKFLLKIHQMSFLFPNSELFYTTLLMVMVVALVVFGYSMIYNPLFGSRTGKLTNRNRWIPQSMREYHHRYGSVIFILLLFMTLTGGIYRFCRNALDIEKASVHWLLELHEMSYLPTFLSVLWIVFIYFALLSISISGSRLLPIINKIFKQTNSYQILSNSSSSSSSSSSNTNNIGSGSNSINNDNINSIIQSPINSSNSSSSNSLIINNNNNQIHNPQQQSSSSLNSNNSENIIININELNSSDGINNNIINNSNSMDDLNNIHDHNSDQVNRMNINTNYDDDDDENNPFRPILNDNRLESMD